MTKAGVVRSDRDLWHDHKGNAKRRGVEFNLTFDVWLAWWVEHLGPDWRSLRGSRIGKYVMARPHDLGAYEIGNIECILHAANIRERHSTVTISQAQYVYTSYESYLQLMDTTGLTFAAIHDIRGDRYPDYTFGLTKSQTHGRCEQPW